MNSLDTIPSSTTVETSLAAMGRLARRAARELAIAPTDAKNSALRHAATQMRARTAVILEANAADLEAACSRGTAPAFLDRLLLNPSRIEAIAKGLEEIAALKDPVGEVIAHWQRAQWSRYIARENALRRHRNHL